MGVGAMKRSLKTPDRGRCGELVLVVLVVCMAWKAAKAADRERDHRSSRIMKDSLAEKTTRSEMWWGEEKRLVVGQGSGKVKGTKSRMQRSGC